MSLFYSVRKWSLLLVAGFLLVGLYACQNQNKNSASDNINLDLPTKSQVGAENLPDTIAPVNAPFAFPNLEKPTFPDDTVRITEKGAEQNSNVRTIINEAIAEVSQQGGGVVVIPSGDWHTGRIELKSNVNLHIEKGAKVHFSGKIKDYLPAVFTRNEGIELYSLGACIYANEQENIAITGGGTLIGPPDSAEVRKKIMNEDVIENVVPHDMPVEERVYNGEEQDWIFPPTFISPTNSKNILIEGITLNHSIFWNIVPVYSENIIIRGITVNSVGVARGDGIDIESSRNVLIEYSTLNTGDDCFTMKAGRGKDGLRVNKPTENVVVRHSLAKKGHGGITIGSETAGTIRNLYIHDSVFNNTCVGIRFKTRRPRGGGGENLYYERLRMNLNCTVIKWDMLGQPKYVGELAERLPPRPVTEITPVYRNIRIKDIIVEDGDHFVKAYGIPESPLENVVIENGIVNSKQLIRLHDTKNITLKDLEIQASDSLIELLNSQNIQFNNIDFDVPGEQIYTEFKAEDSDSIFFNDSNPQQPTGWEATEWVQE
ncbi:glycoside hydrolase family 28 protein [Fodinibius salsisoli]|uniref:Polygalacturonase n=1 Tax=Fodinibius salsisoli TaxID=2820877 RepID=A0ABT3PPZ9_9BACT|nr:glycosyl hydrolase family 28 protein [Fodinibius salsisoli]MCW9707939.1 hypothetical protein [Fodinibius salsisoli]